MNYLKLSFLLLISILIFSCSDEIREGTSENDINIEKRQMTLLDWTPISPCASSNLQIFIDPNCVGTAWGTAINDAVSEFNNASTAVFFTTTTDENAADISLDCTNHNDTGVGGTGQLPQDDNEVGSEIDLNTEMIGFCGAANEPCFLSHIVMHELGHTLGIAHNEDLLGDESGGMEVDWIAGTANPGTTDPGSIFNSGVNCSSTCTFNANDLTALESLYPCACPPRLRISGPKFLCNIGEQATYCVPAGIDLLNWEIPSNMSLVSTNGNCVTVSLTSFNGYGPITAVYQNKGCTYEKDLFVNTHQIPNFDIEYNGPICFGDVVQFNILPLPSHQNLKAINWKVEYGGLNIMSSNDKFAVVEATFGFGPARICATVVNECGREKTYCINVTIQSESDCREDGDLPNPK